MNLHNINILLKQTVAHSEINTELSVAIVVNTGLSKIYFKIEFINSGGICKNTCGTGHLERADKFLRKRLRDDSSNNNVDPDGNELPFGHCVHSSLNGIISC